jgi:tRNA-splicing ligase RtcB (3'-phosphate/5'-hydroxy nucleic acid ligase)
MTKESFEFFEGKRVPIKMWTKGVEVDPNAVNQLYNLSTLPFVYKHVAAMPDVHWGKGATIGSVIATKGAIIPAAVGVDIGCGMLAIRLGINANQLPDNLKKLRSGIEAAVPHGRTDNGGKNDRGKWSDVPERVIIEIEADNRLNKVVLNRLYLKHPKLFSKFNSPPTPYAVSHVGTLGTGNHFIEVCLDEEDNVWIMLHSGSRGVGNRIGTYFIQAAKKDMERWFINLPDRDLAYMVEGSELFEDYWTAVKWAQDFASLNREIMMNSILEVFREQLGMETYLEECAVNCHHNYVALENHFGSNVYITRKGAVRAREGDLGIIPGSMGAKSYIVRGKGNPQSFNSCSHGAGRVMSRTEAKRRFSLEDHRLATAEVECRKDAEVIDETPGAYKDIDAVMAAQSDLVKIVHTLKQVICVKG